LYVSIHSCLIVESSNRQSSVVEIIRFGVTPTDGFGVEIANIL
jgi:hypothetical protein